MEYQQTWFDANAGWVGFVSLLVGIAALVTGFLFYWWSRRPKRFAWELVSRIQLLGSDYDGLRLRLVHGADDTVVEQPNVVVIRIRNNGKVELVSADYDVPVEVRFKDCLVIGAKYSDPSGVLRPTEITLGDKAASFTPSLLNPGEWFEIQFVTDGPLEIPEVVARVAGQTKKVQEMTSARDHLLVRSIFFLVAGFLGLFTFSISTTIRTSGIIGMAFAIALSLATLVCLFLATVSKHLPLERVIVFELADAWKRRKQKKQDVAPSSSR